jgi:hypothetical protein
MRGSKDLSEQEFNTYTSDDLLIDWDKEDPYGATPMVIELEVTYCTDCDSTELSFHSLGLSKREIIAVLTAAMEVAEEMDDDNSKA